MNPPQAWQATLGQLQLEMPKAAFDTWVRDAEFISFQEGIFVIGVRNAYARDWLADRLTSTVQKLLTGILNQTVEVNFVVQDCLKEDEIEDDAEIAEIETIFDLPYDEIVGTGVIAIPAYFGRFHLPVLGPNLAWMVVGFRQAAYSAGRRSGTRKLRISERTIARWSGINRRTFRRRKSKDETWQKLTGFVSLSSTKNAWVSGNGNTPTMAAHAYQVQMTMPLTATHAEALRDWLLSNLDEAGGVESALQLALLMPSEELLSSDDSENQTYTQPVTVLRLMMDLFLNEMPEEQLKAYAQRLQHHIMPPNDQIIITHFFVENLLPLLGPGPSWMLTILRDRCYINRETGENRNQVVVSGGWSEIANWLGLNRPKTVWEWLHGNQKFSNDDNPPQPKNPYLRLFLKEMIRENERQSSFNDAPRSFMVVQEEIPPVFLNATEKTVFDFSNWVDWFSAVVAQLSPMDSYWRECPLSNGANVPYDVAHLSPTDGANVPYGVARLSPANGANVPNLSSLTLKFKHLNSDTQNLPTKDDNGKTILYSQPNGQVGRGGDSDFVWNWDFIFQFNPEINPEDQDILREYDVRVFVAWLIYAYSKKGKGIDSPVMFAVRRVQHGRAEPAEVSMYKKYSPFDLYSFLTHYPTGGHWDDMLPQTEDRRLILKRRLLGQAS